MSLEPLIIELKEDSPGIVFNPKDGIFEISHRSLPENALDFYAPVLEWLEKYKRNPLAKSTFQFKLEYFNTPSSKELYKLLCLLQEISNFGKVEIIWYYQEEDKDMHSAGERYSKLIKLPFTLMQY
jgi:hypothetical protein